MEAEWMKNLNFKREEFFLQNLLKDDVKKCMIKVLKFN
jgi:hypothetical protein